MSGRDGLTTTKGERSRANIIAGMAHFAGTGPDHTFCYQCLHYAYGKRPLAKSQSGRTINHSCGKFRELVGHEGPRFESSSPSCRYWVPVERTGPLPTKGESHA